MKIDPGKSGKPPWYLRPLFEYQRRRYGRVLEGARLWALSPRLFLPVAAFAGAIRRRSSPLPADLRGLVSARVAQVVGCSFCIDFHAAQLLAGGVATEKMNAIADWRESSLFDERECAALAYAEAVCDDPAAIEDALFSDLRRYFDDAGLVELTALIAFQQMSSSFNTALGVPSQGFCPVPTDAGH